MKFLIQRVKEARVSVEGKVIGQIGKGLLIFFGAGARDIEEPAEHAQTDDLERSYSKVKKYAEKIVKMRIFEDENGKTNLSLGDVGGELLVVSQFTLYADCHKGNRPNFLNAAPLEQAEALYEYFVSCCRELTEKVETGSFGAVMEVELCNDGPFTIILDSEESALHQDNRNGKY